MSALELVNQVVVLLMEDDVELLEEPEGNDTSAHVEFIGPEEITYRLVISPLDEEELLLKESAKSEEEEEVDEEDFAT